MLKILVTSKEIKMSQKEEELSELRRKQKEAYRGRIIQDSRDRLKRIANKKFRTCFISALAEFENTFGFELWGHNLPEDKLTPEQKANRIRWEQIRKNILDKGNAQARALGMEIDLHRVEFEGYHMDFGGKTNGH
jgi:vacuolar-type H+-ATPase subunit H